MTGHRRWVVAVLAVLLCGFVAGHADAQARPIPVYVDGLPLRLDTRPVLDSGRLLVPLRAVGEALGLAVDWDARTRTVTLGGGPSALRLRPGERRALRGDEVLALDVPARLAGGRVLVPLRFVGEAFGARVEWDPKAPAVRILSPPRPMVVLGYYALGDRLTSSWRDLFGADYPATAEGRTDLVRHVALGWYSLDAAGNLLTESRTGWRRPEGWERVLEEARKRGLHAEMVVHATDGDGTLTRLLAADEAAARAARAIAAEAAAHYDGVHLDLEGLGLRGGEEEIRAVRAGFTRFVRQLRAALDERAAQTGRALTLTLNLHPLNSAYRGYDYAALGQVADRIVVMAYEYGPKPEPVDRVEEAVRRALEHVPAERLLLGISAASETPESLVAKVGIAKRYRLAGIALWRLGLVAPGEWEVLRTMVIGR